MKPEATWSTKTFYSPCKKNVPVTRHLYSHQQILRSLTLRSAKQLTVLYKDQNLRDFVQHLSKFKMLSIKTFLGDISLVVWEENEYRTRENSVPGALFFNLGLAGTTQKMR